MPAIRINVIRCAPGEMKGVSCGHNHRSITAAQHCRRLQSRAYPTTVAEYRLQTGQQGR